eukprot:TRINITY_DN390_c0_g1_i8.p1 TRINITY_DN390_c0_g1~~TRINITY_DN390_c0_g1_i8.p1  ORF type:complete len:253 (-),score=66.24 TRINITY_DN390_c0_g1_i8:53-811(-)
MCIRDRYMGGFMDLSKIKVRGDEMQQCEERYRKAKTVHTILKQTAINCDIPLIELYKEVVWPLKVDETHMLNIFKMAAQASSPESMFKHVTLKEEIGKELHRQCLAKLSLHAIKIKAEFEVTCYTHEGIDAIKEALNAGMKVGVPETKEETKTEEGEVKIYIIAPPLYECTTQTKEKQKGIDLVNEALKRIEEVIVSKKGKFMRKSDPRVIGEKDEQEESESIGQQLVESSEDEEEGMNIDIQMPSKGVSMD